MAEKASYSGAIARGPARFGHRFLFDQVRVDPIQVAQNMIDFGFGPEGQRDHATANGTGAGRVRYDCDVPGLNPFAGSTLLGGEREDFHVNLRADGELHEGETDREARRNQGRGESGSPKPDLYLTKTMSYMILGIYANFRDKFARSVVSAFTGPHEVASMAASQRTILGGW